MYRQKKKSRIYLDLEECLINNALTSNKIPAFFQNFEHENTESFMEYPRFKCMKEWINPKKESKL